MNVRQRLKALAKRLKDFLASKKRWRVHRSRNVSCDLAVLPPQTVRPERKKGKRVTEGIFLSRYQPLRGRAVRWLTLILRRSFSMSGGRHPVKPPSLPSIRHSTFDIRHSGGSTHTSTRLSMSGGLYPVKPPSLPSIRHSAFPPNLGGREALQGEAGGRDVRWLTLILRRSLSMSGGRDPVQPPSPSSIRHSTFDIRHSQACAPARRGVVCAPCLWQQPTNISPAATC